MERLTERLGDYTNPKEICAVWVKNHDYVSAAHRLADYEDIADTVGGFDRLRELAEADKDGRVTVMPCKVGDVVYGFHGEKTILPMVAKWIETNTDGWCIAVQYTPMPPRFYRFSDFGRTVFLTREEAEKALEAMKDV